MIKMTYDKQVSEGERQTPRVQSSICPSTAFLSGPVKFSTAMTKPGLSWNVFHGALQLHRYPGVSCSLCVMPPHRGSSSSLFQRRCVGVDGTVHLLLISPYPSTPGGNLVFQNYFSETTLLRHPQQSSPQKVNAKRPGSSSPFVSARPSFLDL
ncbi:unnamed protein product [Arctogadus glacialis]